MPITNLLLSISLYILLVLLPWGTLNQSTDIYIEPLLYVEPSASHYGVYRSDAMCGNLGDWHLLELCSKKPARLYVVALLRA